MKAKKRDSSVAMSFKSKRRKEGTARCDVCAWEPPPNIKRFRQRSLAQLLHAHHVVPVWIGGDDHEDNLVLLCPNCHAIAHGIQFTEGTGFTSEWAGYRTPAEFVAGFKRMHEDPEAWGDEEVIRRMNRAGKDESDILRTKAWLASRTELDRRLTLHRPTHDPLTSRPLLGRRYLG